MEFGTVVERFLLCTGTGLNVDLGQLLSTG